MKILLIDLGTTRKEINEPIGICAVASYARKYASFPIDIELRLFPISKRPTLAEISTFDVIGLSTKIGSLNKILEISDLILELPENLRPVLVLGDLIATFATEGILRVLEHAICVVGEGEVSFLQLLQVIRNAKSTGIDLRNALMNSCVENLAYMSNGQYIQNERRLVELTLCPSPGREFASEISKIGGIIRCEGSRGCAWGRCSFCAIQHKYCNETQWRPIAIERIISELKLLSSLGIRSPFYTDEDFIGNDPIRALDLSNAILTAKKVGDIDEKLSLYVDMRADSILSKAHKGAPSGREVLSNLKAAGLREVFVGIESGSKEQVKRYGKASTAARNIQVIDTLRQVGLTFDVGFIMFDPEMCISELFSNIEFLVQTGLNTHDARLTKSLRIEPGTPIVEDYLAKDMLTGGIDIDQLVYPYKWKNADVADVYGIYSHWESAYADDIYTIQAATRGEIESEVLRAEWRRALGEIRTLELSALAYIAKQSGQFHKTSDDTLHVLQDARAEQVSVLLNAIK